MYDIRYDLVENHYIIMVEEAQKKYNLQQPLRRQNIIKNMQNIYTIFYFIFLPYNDNNNVIWQRF